MKDLAASTVGWRALNGTPDNDDDGLSVRETRPITALVRQRHLVDGKSVRDASVRDIQRAARQARLQRGKRRPLDGRRDNAAQTARDAQSAARRLGLHELTVEPRRVGSEFQFTVRVSEKTLRKMFRME